MKGSAKSEAQITHAIENVQKPFSCRAMQEHRICVVGRDPKFRGGSTDSIGNELSDYCFRKSAPKEEVTVSKRDLHQSSRITDQTCL